MEQIIEQQQELNKLKLESYNTEFQIIIRSLDYYFSSDNETFSTLEKLLSGEVDWVELKEMMRQHAIMPPIYYVFSKLPKNLFPESFYADLKRRTFNVSLYNLKQQKELLELSDLFKQNDIEIIPLRGIVLTKEIYQELSHRIFSDMDLLVDKTVVKKIEELLISRGYVHQKQIDDKNLNKFIDKQSEYNFDIFNEQGERRFHLELHWRLAKKDYQIGMFYDELKQFTYLQDFNGKKLKCFIPELLLVTTAAHHGGKDTWRVLKFICDFAAILQKHQSSFDWKLCLKKAEEFKVLHITLVGVGITYKLFRIRIPKEVHQLIFTNNEIEVQINNYLLSYTKSELIISKDITLKKIKLLARMRENTSDRIGLFFRFIFPRLLPNNADIEVVKLPWVLYPFYYIIKLLRHLGVIKPQEPSV